MKLAFKIIFSVLLCAGLWRLFAQYDPKVAPIGLLFASFFWPHLFPREIMNIFSWWKERARYSAVFHWHGKFFVFDGHQVRFYLIDGTIWIPLSDLAPIVEPTLNERELRLLGEDFAVIPNEKIQGLNEQGVLRVLKTRTESRHATYPMIRFKRWLTLSAFPNIRKRPSAAANSV